MTVVDFPPRQLMYWRCGCGCLTQYVRSDGELECADCGQLAEGVGTWRKPPEDCPQDPQTEQSETTIVALTSSHAALERMLRINKDRDLVFVIAADAQGRVSAWGEAFTTRAQRGWLRRMLELARTSLINHQRD